MHWETPERNSIPFHWVHYKSLTKQWIDENMNDVEFLENYIVGFKELLNERRNICGIYEWKLHHTLDNGDEYVISVYIGQSADIICRSYDHMMNIMKFSSWWGIESFDTDILEIVILEEVESQNLLNMKELEWINRLKPWSQNTSGKVIPLDLRNFLPWNG